jgi:hypothetical protein
MNPSQEGFLLEDVISKAVQHLTGVEKNMRENEIKIHFNDGSLNGVDHWISMGNKHILIQDKWKESNTQQEVSQFLTCADRIHSRLNSEDEVYLIWACKKEPTLNSTISLQERGATVVSCSQGLDSLSKCIILEIASILDIDSTKALQSIPRLNIAKPLAPSKRSIQTTPTLSFDETDEGKRMIEEMKAFIQRIQTVLKKVEGAIQMDGIFEVGSIYTTSFPKSSDDWWSSRFSKIDFTAFLKTVKSICWPTNKKKLQSRSLCHYVKLRKLTLELSALANEYDGKRKGLLLKKSSWGKQLPVFKAVADPISEAEYKGALENCEDYWINTWDKKVPNNGLLYAFHTHQCTVY